MDDTCIRPRRVLLLVVYLHELRFTTAVTSDAFCPVGRRISYPLVHPPSPSIPTSTARSGHYSAFMNVCEIHAFLPFPSFTEIEAPPVVPMARFKLGRPWGCFGIRSSKKVLNRERSPPTLLLESILRVACSIPVGKRQRRDRNAQCGPLAGCLSCRDPRICLTAARAVATIIATANKPPSMPSRPAACLLDQRSLAHPPPPMFGMLLRENRKKALFHLSNAIFSSGCKLVVNSDAVLSRHFLHGVVLLLLQPAIIGLIEGGDRMFAVYAFCVSLVNRSRFPLEATTSTRCLYTG